MSTLIINDLIVTENLRELNKQELKLTGGASSASSAGADRHDAVSAGAATSEGDAYSDASGGSRDSYYYGSYESGPSASASASDRYDDYGYYPYY